MINRTQDQITQGWSTGNCRASIVCATYNHERFIGDALDGFLAQITTFPFEIIIHDDASTDGTAKIVQGYKTRYPNIIKTVFQSENQYSKGGFKPTCYAAQSSVGEYIAICEGDDYWIDEQKLQRQVAALEENADVDFSFHAAYTLIANAERMEISWLYGEDGILFLDTLLDARIGSFAPTASYVFRRRIFDELPNWFASQAPVADFFLERYGALRGGALYFNKPMSVYRNMTPGSWTLNIKSNAAAYRRYVDGMCRSLELMEADFKTFSRHFRMFCARFYLRCALEELSLDDKPRFRHFIFKSVEQCRYVSRKQWLSYHLRGLPFLVKHLIRAHRHYAQ